MIDIAKQLRLEAAAGFNEASPETTAANIRGTMLKAAAAIDRLQHENEILYHEREQAKAQMEFCVKILARIHGFISPTDVILPDGRRFEFNNPAIEHDMLKALSAAIRAVPDELKKAESAQPKDEWHGY